MSKKLRDEMREMTYRAEVGEGTPKRHADKRDAVITGYLLSDKHSAQADAERHKVIADRALLEADCLRALLLEALEKIEPFEKAWQARGVVPVGGLGADAWQIQTKLTVGNVREIAELAAKIRAELEGK